MNHSHDGNHDRDCEINEGSREFCSILSKFLEIKINIFVFATTV